MITKTAKFGLCPTCGRRGLEEVIEDVAFRLHGGNRTVPNVPHQCCRLCGERIFDVPASRLIDAVLLPSRKTARRRTGSG